MGQAIVFSPPVVASAPLSLQPWRSRPCPARQTKVCGTACGEAALCYHSEVPLNAGHRLLYIPLFAGILAYSQTTTLDWDEGFHLIAASLIAAGKRPYIDFCFPQPFLHAWWNALWLSLTGPTWRVPQFVAALLTCGTVALTADFVYRRVPVPGWQPLAAYAAALLVGLNAIIYEFGTTAQAYGACTFLTVAAFRAAVAQPIFVRTFIAGCLAGAAAGCSLLTAPACLVLFLWHCWRRQLAHAAAYLLGVIVPLVPLLLAFIRAPFQTWFNLVGYHVFFRRNDWTGASGHDFQVLTSWVDCGQTLLLALLAVAGLLYVWKSNWSRERKAEFYLAACMAIGLAAEAATAHPTFAQYFIFIVPLVAIPAAVGFCDITSRLCLPPRWALSVLAGLFLLSLVNSLVEMRDDNNTWTNMGLLARKIEQVTPAGGTVLADPPVYFAMHRPPLPGAEFPASQKVELPPEQAATLHIIPQSQMERRVRRGDFATVETCKGDEDEIQALQLPKFYSNSETIAGCTVYWTFR